MSLDVYLISTEKNIKVGTGVFVRENGKNIELTIEEVRERYPNHQINEFEYEEEYIYSSNITHNLGKMASEAGIYEALWRPYRLRPGYDMQNKDYNAECEFESSQKIYASEIIELLEKGLNDLKSRPLYFKKFDSPNGWGVYDDFVPFVENYLNACKKYPNSIVEVSR